MPSALQRVVCATVVNQDAPHEPGGNPEEMTAILPSLRRLVHQPEVGFMNEVCWLQRMPPALASQVRRGQTTELTVDQWNKVGQTVTITGRDIVQQPRHVASR